MRNLAWLPQVSDFRIHGMSTFHFGLLAFEVALRRTSGWMLI